MALAVGAALAVLLGVCVRLAGANVMGIDLGSEFMKVRSGDDDEIAQLSALLAGWLADCLIDLVDRSIG